MKLSTRRIIMFSFILAFFILAPILIFYTSGYRLDLKRRQILKTGTFLLEGKDIKSANLYINNELYKESFDEKIFIYNLLPGDYRIRLEKDGYYPWQKKISITSSLTTFVKDAILFKKEIPLQIIEGQIGNFYFSPDRQKIIYSIETDSFLEFYLLDLTTKEKNLLYRIPQLNQDISLSFAASSKKALIKVADDYLVLDLQNPSQNLDLKGIINFKPATLKWDIESDNLLYAQSDNSIYRIDLLAKKSEKIFNLAGSKLNPEFFIEKNDLFYIQREENQNALNKYNLGSKNIKKIIEFAKSNNYKFIASTNNFIGLIDEDQEKLFLIKKIVTDLGIDINANEPIKEFRAKDALWDDKEKELLIYDDFEISTYNSETGEEIFINRYGQIIKKAAWYPDLLHLIVLFENNLQIIDINQENGTKNSIEVAKFDELGNFYLDKKNEIIYFNGKIGKQSGLYQLSLK